MMDIRGLLSENSTRSILVFFENTMLSFNHDPSISRREWFEKFREYLDVSPQSYSISKNSGRYSEDIIFARMQGLDKKLKAWVIECALEMISSDNDFDLSDVRITAKRVSKALDIQEKDFYDAMISKTADNEVNIKKQNDHLAAKRTIYFSKFKTTTLFYTSGDHVVEIFEDDTLILTAPNEKKYHYVIINAVQERNDFFFFLKNPRSGALGYFKMMPQGKAELKFDTGSIVKLKI